MQSDLKFSVAINVYGKDNPAWFQKAMESILNQTVVPNEIILVVDGPVPMDVDHVINQYSSNSLIRVVRLKKNLGHGNARRVALNNCTNNLVALMDADDVSLPDRFEKQIAVFRDNPEISVLGGNIAEFVGEPDNIVGYRLVKTNDYEIKKDLKKRCPFNQMTVMLAKDKVEKSGGYLDWFCNEDYYLWNRMYLTGNKFMNVDDVLVNVRIGEELYKRRGGWKYFKSEFALQRYMLSHGIINYGLFIINVAKRAIVQILLPNSIRGVVFKKFARKQSVKKG